MTGKPSKPVLLALHYQNEVLHRDGRIRVGLAEGDGGRDTLVLSAQRLLAHARARAWPIIHVRIAFRPDYADCPVNMPIFRRVVELGAVKEGEWGSAFLGTLAPVASAREFVVTHTRISAFAGTALEQTLRMLDAQRLLVAGVATHSVVEGTVRDAVDRGFEVYLAADACAAASPQTHEAALASMALVAEITTVDAAFTLMEGSAA